MPSLDSVTFDTSGLRFDRTETGRKVWFNDAGDGISLNFFNQPPDLPAGIDSPERLRDAYLSMLANSPAKLVEVDAISLSGCRAVRLIIKVPQKTSGNTYVGSITIPFRDFSFVLKAQCEEHGITGLRETVLFDKFFAAGKITISEPAKVTGQPNYDDEQFDPQFPKHPLSRLRGLLRQIEASCAVAPETQALPRF